MAAAALPLLPLPPLPITTPATGAAAPQPAAPQSPRASKARAFDLYCQGLHSPAIAAELGISERTIRNWVQTTIQQLAQDDDTANPETARQQRALAIESQRAVVATAWAAYHQLSAAYTRILSLALAPTSTQPQPAAAACNTAAAVNEASVLMASLPDPQRLLANANRLAGAAARHLALVISANREIARLQGQAAAQATREQRAATQQATADARQLEADLLRAFTAPIASPAPLSPAHLPALDDLSPMSTVAPSVTTLAGNDAPGDITPIPDHIIAALLRRLREEYPEDEFDLDGSDGTLNPTAATSAAPPLPSEEMPQRTHSESPAKTAKTTTPAKTATIPATSDRHPASPQPLAPPKTKIAAKTAMSPAAHHTANHQPSRAVPRRAAHKRKIAHAGH